MLLATAFDKLLMISKVWFDVQRNQFSIWRGGSNPISQLNTPENGFDSSFDQIQMEYMRN